MKVSSKRIALYDQYGGSMPSGWTRLEFENFEIPYQVVYPTDLDAGNLKSKFDVLILPSGAQIRGAGGVGFGGRGGGGARTRIGRGYENGPTTGDATQSDTDAGRRYVVHPVPEREGPAPARAALSKTIA